MKNNTKNMVSIFDGENYYFKNVFKKSKVSMALTGSRLLKMKQSRSVSVSLT